MLLMVALFFRIQTCNQLHVDMYFILIYFLFLLNLIGAIPPFGLKTSDYVFGKKTFGLSKKDYVLLLYYIEIGFALRATQRNYVSNKLFPFLFGNFKAKKTTAIPFGSCECLKAILAIEKDCVPLLYFLVGLEPSANILRIIESLRLKRQFLSITSLRLLLYFLVLCLQLNSLRLYKASLTYALLRKANDIIISSICDRYKMVSAL